MNSSNVLALLLVCLLCASMVELLNQPNFHMCPHCKRMGRQLIRYRGMRERFGQKSVNKMEKETSLETSHFPASAFKANTSHEFSMRLKETPDRWENKILNFVIFKMSGGLDWCITESLNCPTKDWYSLRIVNRPGNKEYVTRLGKRGNQIRHRSAKFTRPKSKSRKYFGNKNKLRARLRTALERKFSIKKRPMLRSNTSVSKKPRTKLRSKSRANFGNRKKTKRNKKIQNTGRRNSWGHLETQLAQLRRNKNSCWVTFVIY